jgi:Protein of unknown function (DUF2934)
MDHTLEDNIRKRAYELWIAEGCVHGRGDHYWLAAERELLALSTVACSLKLPAQGAGIVPVPTPVVVAREPAPQKKRRVSRHSRLAKAATVA